MKRGFALLETIIVITFVAISLLLLYGTFTSLINTKEENIRYDDVASIYEMYYLKEYLLLNGLEDYMLDEDIILLSCSDFAFTSCSSFLSTLSLENLYLVRYGVKEISEDTYAYSLSNYLRTLSNNDNYDYLLVGEFLEDGTYYYASIGVMSDE